MLKEVPISGILNGQLLVQLRVGDRNRIDQQLIVDKTAYDSLVNQPLKYRMRAIIYRPEDATMPVEDITGRIAKRRLVPHARIRYDSSGHSLLPGNRRY